jgi:hypothetical protein
VSVASVSRAFSQPEPFTPELEQKIRFRAYELYLLRGQTPGSELQDWLQAEAGVAIKAPSRTDAKPRQPRKRETVTASLKKKK